MYYILGLAKYGADSLVCVKVKLVSWILALISSHYYNPPIKFSCHILHEITGSRLLVLDVSPEQPKSVRFYISTLISLRTQWAPTPLPLTPNIFRKYDMTIVLHYCQIGIHIFNMLITIRGECSEKHTYCITYPEIITTR